MEEIYTLATKLSGASLGLILLLIIYGGYKRYWVWGYQLEEMRSDRDEWKNMALRGTNLTERAANLTERAVSLATKQP